MMLQVVIVLSLLTKVFGMETDGLNSRVYISEEIAGLAGRIYTDGVLETTATANEIECARRCSHSDGCLSFFYSKDTRICQMHRGELNTTAGNPYSAAPEYRYYKMKGKATRTTPAFESSSQPEVDGTTPAFGSSTNAGQVGMTCVTAGECTIINSECRTGICGCQAGYSFHPGNKTCEIECEAYGNTFQVFSGYFIRKNNREELFDKTPEECVLLCINATGYICRTFDMKTSENRCTLQEVDASDVGKDYGANSAYIHYQRNCA